MSDKFNISLSELSQELAKAKLLEKNIDQLLLKNIFEIVDTCEFARYAPGSVDKKPEELLNEAIITISKIDNNI